MIPSSCPHAPGRRKRVCNRVVEFPGLERAGSKAAGYQDLAIGEELCVMEPARRYHRRGSWRKRVGRWVENFRTDCGKRVACEAACDQHFAGRQKSRQVG